MPQTLETEVRVSLLDWIDAAVILLDRNGVIQYANKHVCKDMGKPLKAIQGMHCRQVFWPEFLPLYERIQVECEKNQKYV